MPSAINRPAEEEVAELETNGGGGTAALLPLKIELAGGGNARCAATGRLGAGAMASIG